jgi:hypothetical protein
MRRKFFDHIKFTHLSGGLPKIWNTVSTPFSSLSAHEGEKGQSLVEMALSLVILLTILAGIVDGARALFTYMALRDAAQEGALYGQLVPSDTTGITRRVMISSDTAENSAGVWQVSISYTDPSNNTKNSNICLGDGITVRVTHPNFPVTMPFIGIFTGNSFDISATIADTVLQPRCP